SKKVSVLTVAGVTFANGGDNIGVYVPVFLNVDTATVIIYCVVFLILVAGLVLLAKFVATRPPIAEVLERWEHVLFPIVLIGLGIFILVSGGAFGL
ncbi:cadmium resistance transporter, partial [Corynebacterium sanguinis]